MSKLLVDEISDADNTGPVTVTDGLTVQGAFTSLGIDDNATSTAMTLDASGNLLVGTTDSNPTSSAVNVAGQSFSTTGGVRSTVASNPAATFNRKTDDGDIAAFRKDGTTVGSIGSYVNLPYIGKSDVNLLFDPTGPHIVPRGTNGGARDAAINLGSSSNRFKDLYISGGVYLGGTGSANHLDDYEEGTHEVTFTTQTSGTITLSATANLIRYTKVGNTVSLQGRVVVASVSSPVGYINISLPFAIATGAEQSNFTALNCWTHAVNLASNTMTVFLEGSGGLAAVIPYQMRNNLSWTDFPSANLVGSGNEVFYIVGTYMTDS